MEKERRTKALLLSTLVVVVATLSIAFAAMSRTLSINGIGKMDTASWSVYFDNLSSAKTTRGAEEVGKPKISDDKGTIQDINVKLSNPKDEISYTVDIVNDGTIDAEITMIKDIELTDAQKKVFEFKVTYTDTGEILKDGDILPKKTTKNITISIKFKDDITEFDLPSESQTISLSYQITYTQYDGDVPVGPNGGGVTTEKAVLASVANPDAIWDEDASEPFFNCTSITREEIESISFINNKNVPEEASSTIWDASEAKDNSIIGWYQPSNTEGLYDVYIGSDANIFAPENSLGLFALFFELKELKFNNFNTSDVMDMSYLFFCDILLTTLDLSKFNTKNVTNMGCMFVACESLSSLDLSSFNTSNVTDMNGMFEGCSLTSLDLSDFDTTNVTNMQLMFSECSLLTSLDVSNFNTKNVTNMGWMFNECESLSYLDLSSFDTSNVTDVTSMFLRCNVLKTLDLRNADFSNVTKASMFGSINQLSRIIVKDETQRTWLTSKYPELTNVVLPSEL